MRICLAILFAATIGFGIERSCSADITTFVYDFSLGDQDASPATGSNVAVTANPYVARANTELLEADSGIELGKAVVYGHITPAVGTHTTWQTFSLETNNPAHEMSLNTIDFVYDMKGLIASSPFFSGTMQVDVLASIDGFTTAGVNLGTATLVKVSNQPKPPAQNVSITVTDPTFKNFSGTIDFRMAFSDTLGAGDNDSAHTIDNLAINVTGVPEPASIGFAFAALCGLGFRRRRRAS